MCADACMGSIFRENIPNIYCIRAYSTGRWLAFWHLAVQLAFWHLAVTAVTSLAPHPPPGPPEDP